MHVRWGSTFTSSFHVSNGLKQGGILSPMLFNVYMDPLSIQLNRSGIGQARVQGGAQALEIEKPKKKKKVIRANIKLFHLYFATFLVVFFL